MERCSWALVNAEMIAYHDTEWGRPCFDDRKIYQAFLLDTFQAGLSWAIILSKRQAFQKAFADFNVAKVSAYGRGDVARLLQNTGIVRNARKIEAAITNAQQIVNIQKEHGTFATYLWAFSEGKAIQHAYARVQNIPTTSKEAEAMARDMRQRGLRFVGPTTIYAFMQGIGMVNDHITSCCAYLKAKNSPSGRF